MTAWKIRRMMLQKGFHTIAKRECVCWYVWTKFFIRTMNWNNFWNICSIFSLHILRWFFSEITGQQFFSSGIRMRFQKNFQLIVRRFPARWCWWFRQSMSRAEFYLWFEATLRCCLCATAARTHWGQHYFDLYYSKKWPAQALFSCPLGIQNDKYLEWEKIGNLELQ